MTDKTNEDHEEAHRSDFLAMMSHEIRTPMQTIYGLLELMGEEEPPPRIASMLETAKKSSGELLKILDDILDLSKIGAGKMEIDHFEVPVRTLVNGLVEALAVKVHSRQVALLEDIEEDVPHVVTGDPKRLRQVLMNLTSNALKFTQTGSVKIRVTKRPQELRVPPGQIGLRFEVIDTGIGMEKDVCNRLFQPFTQADTGTTRKFGGTGLGLSISKQLIDLMGGEIGVDSTPGYGSVFWFEIPVEVKEHDIRDNLSDLPDLEGITVLVVDDHPQAAREICRALDSMNAKVDWCPNFAEGKERITKRPYDVAILDQRLPDGDGIDLARYITRTRSSTGVILYTVMEDSVLQFSCQSLGVAYLSKPASRLGLGKAVSDAAKTISLSTTDLPKKVLIAEDTESVQLVLRRQLDNLGVDADIVSSGQEAFDAYQKGEYGLVITDLHMHGMDGYTLAQAIRNDETEKGKEVIPLVVMTADVQISQRNLYFQYGFNECLLKPVSLAQMRRLFMRWTILSGREDEPALRAEEVTPKNDTKPGNLNAVDLDMLCEMMEMPRDEAVEMVKMFAEMSVKTIDKIQALAQAENHKELAEAAHSLKGAARSACCNVLGDLASSVQESAEESRVNWQAISQLGREFEELQRELESY